MIAELEAAIMEIMTQHRGSKHAIPRAHLLALLRSQGFDISDRFLREVYTSLLYRLPIGYSSDKDGGLFLCDSDEDLEIAERQDKARIAALHERIAARRRSYYANRKVEQMEMVC